MEKFLTVGELRKFIEALPDEMPVATRGNEYGACYRVDLLTMSSVELGYGMYGRIENCPVATSVLVIDNECI